MAAAKRTPVTTAATPPRVTPRPAAPPTVQGGRKNGGPAQPPTPQESARAVQGMENAAKLIEDQKPGLAIGILLRVIPYLPTHADSVKAFYHMSEALLQTSEKTGDASAKGKACDILSKLRQDPARTMASSVDFLYGQECK